MLKHVEILIVVKSTSRTLEEKKNDDSLAWIEKCPI
jgi:hypothetical protein